MPNPLYRLLFGDAKFEEERQKELRMPRAQQLAEYPVGPDALRGATASGEVGDAYSQALRNVSRQSLAQAATPPGAKGALDMATTPIAFGASAAAAIPRMGRDTILSALNRISGQNLYKDTTSGTDHAMENLNATWGGVKDAYAPAGRDLARLAPDMSGLSSMVAGGARGISDLIDRIIPGGGPASATTGAGRGAAGPMGTVDTAESMGLGDRAPTGAARGVAIPRSARSAAQGALVPRETPMLPRTADNPEYAARDMEGSSQGPDATASQLAGGGGATSAESPARMSLQALYQQELGKIDREVKGDLSPDQRNNVLLRLGLGMMSGGSRPGSTMLGALGESGLGAVDYADRQRATNKGERRQQIADQRDELKQLIGFADKDSDNVRADVAQKALADYHAKTLDIEREKLAGLKTDREAKNAIAQAKLELTQALGEAKNEVAMARIEAGIARQGAAAANNQNPLNILTQLYGKAAYDAMPPEEKFRRVLQLRGGDRESMSDDKGYDRYVSDFEKAITNLGKQPMSRQDWEARRNGTAPAAGAGKPATEAAAHQQARDAISKGAPKSEINRRLQEWGYKTL